MMFCRLLTFHFHVLVCDGSMFTHQFCVYFIVHTKARILTLS
jgi:hypothetical protein